MSRFIRFLVAASATALSSIAYSDTAFTVDLSTRNSGGAQNLDETLGVYALDPLDPSFPIVDISFDLATVSSTTARFRGELYATFTRSNGFGTQVQIWEGSRFSVLNGRGTERESNFSTSVDLSSSQFPGSPSDYTTVSLEAFLRRVSPNAGSGSFTIDGGLISLDPLGGGGGGGTDPDDDLLDPHVLYLDFDGGSVDLSQYGPLAGPPGTAVWTVDPYGSTQLREGVRSRVESIFDGLNLEVTLTRPTEGNFSTVVIGGSGEDIPNARALNVRTNQLGFAEMTIGQADLNGVSYALAETIEQRVIAGGLNNGSLFDYLAQTVAHEFGHTMGLMHIADSNNLMFPSALSLPTALSPRAPVYETTTRSDGTVVDEIWTLGIGTVVTVDAFEYLASKIGYENGELGTQGAYSPTPETFGQFLKRILFNSADVDLYDVRLGVSATEDSLPTIVEIGDLARGSEGEIESLAALQGSFFLTAASTPGGPRDVWGISSLADFDRENPDLKDMLFSIGGSESFSSIGLFDVSTDDLTPLGSLRFSRLVPEPTSVVLVVLGWCLLAARSRR